MAEADDSEKTEQPTQKRLDDAREKGQVAASREINHWFMFLGAAIFVMMFAPAMLEGMGLALIRFVEQPHLITSDGGSMRDALLEMCGRVALLLALPAGLLLVAAAAPGVLQNGFLFSTESIKPKLDKISPLAGAKRLFSLRSLMEFAKGLIKLAIVGTVLAMLLWPEFDRLELAVGLEAAALLDLIGSLTARLLIGVLAVMTLIAALDFLYQKFEHLKQLRMSRQELKEEFKQSEGDPMIKQRLRQIRIERSRRRMLAAVPDADVVITNPTHFAVALKYDPARMSAPTLVAKGADHVAARIREVARENGVPLVENPPLARALHAGVELDQEIPAEHYRAVAEIISYIWKLRQR